MIESWLSMYRQRDMRVGPMPEPQWRILLDLAANGECSITSACIASGAAPTTALRHIGILQERGLIGARDDERDWRRRWLSLSEAGAGLLRAAQTPSGEHLYEPNHPTNREPGGEETQPPGRNQ